VGWVPSGGQTQRRSVKYGGAVAYLTSGGRARAAEGLASMPDPAGSPPADSDREAILLQAWQLALVLHPEMQKRVGGPQLAMPGRRMDAIAAVERSLAKNPDNPTAWDLKRILYTNLTEAEYNHSVGKEGTATEMDQTHVQ